MRTMLSEQRGNMQFQPPPKSLASLDNSLILDRHFNLTLEENANQQRLPTNQRDHQHYAGTNQTAKKATLESGRIGVGQSAQRGAPPNNALRCESYSAIQDEAKLSFGNDEEDASSGNEYVSSFASFNN